MSLRKKAFSAVVLGATLSSSLIFAEPAFAADDPLKAGELQITPASGTVATPWDTLSTNAGEICPEGFRFRSFAYAFPVNDGIPDFSRMNVAPGTSIRATDSSPTALGSAGGLRTTDIKINRVGGEAWSANWNSVLLANDSNTHIQSGTWEIRHTCQAGSSYKPETDRYYSVGVQISGQPGDAARTWSVVPEEGGSSATATTTTVTGNATSATSATLLASVSPAEAAGTVQFQVNGADAGAPVTVSGGTASTSVSGIAAGSNVSISAVFTPDNAETYRASTGTGSVTTPPHATIDVPIGGEVPAETPATPTGLKLSVEGAGKPLAGTAERKEGQTWQATGALPNITVTDDDRKTDKWTLNGQVRDLTVSEGKPTIAAANLGWDPALVSAATGSVKGAKVDPNQDGGLGTAKALATGNGTTDANLTTVVNGGLTLNVPTGAPAGAYKTTLTLTLI